MKHSFKGSTNITKYTDSILPFSGAVTNFLPMTLRNFMRKKLTFSSHHSPISKNFRIRFLIDIPPIYILTELSISIQRHYTKPFLMYLL